MTEQRILSTRNNRGVPSASTSSKPRPPSPPPVLHDKSGSEYIVGIFLGQVIPSFWKKGGFARCYQVTTPKGDQVAVKVVNKPSLKSTKMRNKVIIRHSFYRMDPFILELWMWTYVSLFLKSRSTSHYNIRALLPSNMCLKIAIMYI